MESQKVKNKKTIGLIYWILTLLLGAGGLLFLISVLLLCLTLINPEFEPFFPIVDVPLSISEKAILEFKDGTQSEIFIDNAFVSFNINKEYGFSGILNYIYFASILLIAYYIIFLLWNIFRSIRVSLKKDNPFHYKNIWRIRLIAIAVLFSALLKITYPFIMKYLWFNKVVMFDQAFDIRLNFNTSINLFWGLVILVIAEIYRIGLEIKKDQELTI